MSPNETTQKIEADEIVKEMSKLLDTDHPYNEPCTPAAHAEVIKGQRELYRASRWIVRRLGTDSSHYHKPPPASESPSGNWLQIGKLKSAGLPAIIIAAVIAWGLWQQMQSNKFIAETKAALQAIQAGPDFSQVHKVNKDSKQ